MERVQKGPWVLVEVASGWCEGASRTGATSAAKKKEGIAAASALAVTCSVVGSSKGVAASRTMRSG